MRVSRRSFIKGLTACGAATVLPTAAEAREPLHTEPGDVGMLYDSTLCIGCRACVTKCKEANFKPADAREFRGAAYDAPDDLSDTTLNIIKMRPGPDQNAYIKMQCMHCVDPACVSVCMAGALHKIDKGIVAYDKIRCVGCRYCQVACPFDVPKFMWHSATPLIVKCELCRHRKEGPACCQYCPSGAVIYDDYQELLRIAHQRIEDEPDRYYPKVYGENDAGGLHVIYLVDKNQSFQKLGLPKLPDEPLPQMSESVQHTVYRGFVAPIALYGLLVAVQFKNRRKNPPQEPPKEDSDE